jgi:hypothetical protein
MPTEAPETIREANARTEAQLMDPIKDLVKLFEQDAERAREAGLLPDRNDERLEKRREEKASYWLSHALDENGQLTPEFCADLFRRTIRRDPRSAKFLHKVFSHVDGFTEALGHLEEREKYG